MSKKAKGPKTSEGKVSEGRAGYGLTARKAWRKAAVKVHLLDVVVDVACQGGFIGRADIASGIESCMFDLGAGAWRAVLPPYRSPRDERTP